MINVHSVLIKCHDFCVVTGYLSTVGGRSEYSTRVTATIDREMAKIYLTPAYESGLRELDRITGLLQKRVIYIFAPKTLFVITGILCIR